MFTLGYRGHISLLVCMWGNSIDLPTSSKHYLSPFVCFLLRELTIFVYLFVLTIKEIRIPSSCVNGKIFYANNQLSVIFYHQEKGFYYRKSVLFV